MDHEFRHFGLPGQHELLGSSALLVACPRLLDRHAAEEVAIAEYCHYATQTYIFEVVGFQILGEMACSLRSFEFVHELASQARDEAVHAETYRQVVRDLPVKLLPAPFEAQASPIYDAFVKNGSCEEKVVASYFVLESIAMGIFGARQRCYRTSHLAEVDHRFLADEAHHQSMGVRIVVELVRDGRLSLRQVNDVVRSAGDKVAQLLVPSALFERFSIEGDSADRKRVQGSGFLAIQRAISQKAMLNSLRSLNRSLAERPRYGGNLEVANARAA